MKIKFAQKFPYLALLTALIVGSGQALAIAQLDAVEGTVGTVYFFGGLLSSPCTLAPESQEQSVNMGDISARNFKKVGDRSAPVVFNLRLEDCLLGANYRYEAVNGQGVKGYLQGEQAVAVTLLGDSDNLNIDLLHMNGETEGIGLRFLDRKGNLLALNTTLNSQILQPGDNNLELIAMFESTQKNIIAGSFNSVLHLKLEYL